jgi:cell wall-active antibiotic response 4TMS protein YvqF
LPEQRPDRGPAHNHLIVGLVILGLGCILLLDQIGILDAGRVFLFWPLLLVYFGYRKFTGTRTLSGRFWGGFVLLLGLAFQAEALGFRHVRFDTIWPVLLICAGILLILKRYEMRSDGGMMPPDTPGPPGPPIDIPPGTPAPPASDTASGPAPSPPPVSASGSMPGASTPPPGATGAATSSFGAAGPAQTHSNFAGGPSRPGWPDGEQNREEFRRHMHEFGQRMDEFGERMYEKWRTGGQRSQTGAPQLNEVNIFWGGKKKIISRNFTGGEVVAIFGGFEIDLTEADMAGQQIEIEAICIFGGGEVRVPRNWEVVMETIGIFGGSTDRTWHPDQAPPGPSAPGASPTGPAKRIIIKGVTIFGGLHVKN